MDLKDIFAEKSIKKIKSLEERRSLTAENMLGMEFSTSGVVHYEAVPERDGWSLYLVAKGDGLFTLPTRKQIDTKLTYAFVKGFIDTRNAEISGQSVQLETAQGQTAYDTAKKIGNNSIAALLKKYTP